jgi:quercetin dioxygenase-like cupin family protein
VRSSFSGGEQLTLRGLQRGVYAKNALPPGHRIGADDVFYAMPSQEGQLTANDISKYRTYFLLDGVDRLAPLYQSNVHVVDTRDAVYRIVQKVKAIIRNSGIPMPGQSELELSHHYGIENFEQYGITMITIVNRDYCKKLLVLLPGQNHPEQYHKTKEETFHILHGEIDINLDGIVRPYGPGSVITIEKGVKHSFRSEAGAIIEEISTTHHKDDSYYTDERITQRKDRKTILTYWMD